MGVEGTVTMAEEGATVAVVMMERMGIINAAGHIGLAMARGTPSA